MVAPLVSAVPCVAKLVGQPTIAHQARIVSEMHWYMFFFHNKDEAGLFFISTFSITRCEALRTPALSPLDLNRQRNPKISPRKQVTTLLCVAEASRTLPSPLSLAQQLRVASFGDGDTRFGSGNYKMTSLNEARVANYTSNQGVVLTHCDDDWRFFVAEQNCRVARNRTSTLSLYCTAYCIASLRHVFSSEGCRSRAAVGRPAPLWGQTIGIKVHTRIHEWKL